MNKVISFILGALVMFVITFSINILKDDSIDINDTTSTSSTSDIVEVQENKGDITKEIAFVNNDVGVGETNVAKSLIENMPMKNGYEVVTTTYNDAMSGLENDEYVAYVMFDSNYTATLLSVALDELPEKAKIYLKVNPNLSDEQLIETNQVLFTDYMYIKDTINYIYIAYLLDIVHNTQDDVSSIIGNEEYMNSISKNVADYTTSIVSSLTDYINEPPSTEIELNLEGLQGLAEKNIEQISEQFQIDSDQLLSTIANAQAQFNESINQSLLDSDLEANQLTLSFEDIEVPNSDELNEQLNTYLVNNIENISEQKVALENAQAILNGYNETVDNMPELKDIEILNVLKTMITASLQNDPNQINSLPDSYKFEVINNFVLSYAQWYAGANEINLEACSADELDTCMDQFKDEYDEHFAEWGEIVNDFKTVYIALTDDESDIRKTIDDALSSIDSILANIKHRDQNYITNILEDQSIEGDIGYTTDYCNGMLLADNIVSDLVCGVYGFGNIIGNYNTIVDATAEEVAEHNAELEAETEQINTSIDNANSEVDEKLATQADAVANNVQSNVDAANELIANAQVATNETISTVNENKNNFIANVVTALQDYQTELNESISSVEESQYDDRQSIYDNAITYNEQYAVAADGYTTNINLLNLFANILPSTRNGNDANYYLYDYLVNPLDVVAKTGTKDTEESIDPIVDTETVETTQPQTDESKNMFIVILIAIILIGGLGGYMVVNREDYDD